MPEKQKTTRKLKAMLSADVKGCSLLMADGDVFTIRTLKETMAQQLTFVLY